MVPYQRIFHPTSFLASDVPAFAQALKLPCLMRGELTIMHVGHEDFEEFPRVRPFLAQWGLLPEGSAPEDVQTLGIRINKIRAIAGKAAATILHHLAEH